MSIKAILKLKEGLSKFKEDCNKNGWEDDEVDEKVADVFESNMLCFDLLFKGSVMYFQMENYLLIYFI